MPTTIKFSTGFIEVTGGTANGFAVIRGHSSSVTGSSTVNYIYLQTAGSNGDRYCEVQVEIPGTLYLQTGTAANTAGWYQSGWIEDPSEYK